MFTRKMVSPVCCFIFLAVFSLAVFQSALAVDFTDDNYDVQELPHCEIISLNTNRFDGSRPLIIFLPGYMECDNINHVAHWIREYDLYDEVDADIVTTAFWQEPAGNGSWRFMAEDLAGCLSELETAGDLSVVIDSVSSSGFCGCYLAQLLRDKGVHVQELNLAEACSTYGVTVDLIRELAASGIRVNIWIGSEEAVWSKDSREYAAELEGTENVYSTVLNVEKHGQELAVAIHEHGLHR